eukprot:762883-Rhodomonas_salina.3
MRWEAGSKRDREENAKGTRESVPDAARVGAGVHGGRLFDLVVLTEVAIPEMASCDASEDREQPRLKIDGGSRACNHATKR